MSAAAFVKTLRPLVPGSLRRRIADWRGRGPYAGYPDRYRCIFIHVPKAAGTSVAQSLFGAASRHVDYHEYERANPAKFRHYFKFTFVRNPWDRLLSAYTFLLNGGMNDMDAAWAAEHLANIDEFRDFVQLLVERPELLQWVHLRPQHSFLCNEHGDIKVDFVGRVENIEVDFATIAARIGVPANLSIRNRSDHVPYADIYDARSREQVARLYRSDIEIFGYSFDR